jgi:hypothetical protein
LAVTEIGMFVLVFISALAYAIGGKWALVVAIPLCLPCLFGK